MPNKDYALRIANATPNELNVITFEICINNITKALENIELDQKLFNKNLDTALSALREIIISLNFDYPIAYELHNMYLYVNKLIINSKFNLNPQNLADAIELLTTLKEGFEQINDTNSEAVMKNATKVFAGLTYGKGGLSEYIDPGESRGFKA